MQHWLSLVATLTLAFVPAHVRAADAPRNESLLSCYDDLKNSQMSTATKSSYLKHWGRQYLVLPSKRGKEHGFYFVVNKIATWVPLPPPAAKEVYLADGKDKYVLRNCFRFDDPHGSGEIFVNYGNYEHYTNPGNIERKKPDHQECGEKTPFSDIKNEELDLAIEMDLVTRIQSTVQPVQNNWQTYANRKKRFADTKDLEVYPGKVLKALDTCAGRLDKENDKLVLEAIEVAKGHIERLNKKAQDELGAPVVR